MSEGARSLSPSRGATNPWLVRGAVIVSVVFACAAATGVVIDRLEAMSAPVPSVLGLRLGATVDDLRAARGGDDWTTRVDQSGDLEVSHGEDRYSFHEGLLVAVDVRLDASMPDASGPPRVVTAGSVLVRDPSDSGVRVRLVSRTCPTHAEAAEALVRGPSP